MVMMCLFPVGILQAHASVAEGFWYARTAEQQAIIHFLVWMRVPGDVVFSTGAIILAIFVMRLALTLLPEKTPAELAAPAK